MFNNSFCFNGRIRRLEYGLSYVIYLIAIFIVVGVLMALGEPSGILTNFLMIVLWIPLVCFLFTQGAKRCHDRGNSGWWQFIPFYGFWMLSADGEIGGNEHGGNSKNIANTDEVNPFSREDKNPLDINEQPGDQENTR